MGTLTVLLCIHCNAGSSVSGLRCESDDEAAHVCCTIKAYQSPHVTVSTIRPPGSSYDAMLTLLPSSQAGIYQHRNEDTNPLQTGRYIYLRTSLRMVPYFGCITVQYEMGNDDSRDGGGGDRGPSTGRPPKATQPRYSLLTLTALVRKGGHDVCWAASF